MTMESPIYPQRLDDVFSQPSSGHLLWLHHAGLGGLRLGHRAWPAFSNVEESPGVSLNGAFPWGVSQNGWFIFMENPNLKWMFQDGFIFETFEVKLGVASLFLGDVWEQISR